jgi:hypothetical protein
MDDFLYYFKQRSASLDNFKTEFQKIFEEKEFFEIIWNNNLLRNELFNNVLDETLAKSIFDQWVQNKSMVLFKFVNMK